MNYVDATLVRLADPAARPNLYDAASIEQLAATAYDTDAMAVEGPYQPVFEEFRVGFSLPSLGFVEGAWNTVGSTEKVNAFFHVSGLGNGGLPRVDAYWRGAIVARTVPASGHITDVAMDWPDVADIDEEIEVALGGLPQDPQALEEERRNRFLSRVRGVMDQPQAFTGDMLDRWLAEAKAGSVGDLLSIYRGTVHGGAVRITFSPPEAAAPSPRRLPIAAVLMIRDEGFSVAQLLTESKLVQERLQSLALERPRDPSLLLRHELLVIWVVPISVFDDSDWPGGGEGMDADQLRTARRTAAGQWLAREGIGLVATP